jgi:hypothetical protein
MAATEAEAAAEALPEDRDSLGRGGGGRGAGAKRSVGSMAALSGAVGLRYLEYSTRGAPGAGRGGGQGRPKPGGAGKLAKFRRM